MGGWCPEQHGAGSDGLDSVLNIQELLLVGVNCVHGKELVLLEWTVS
jgi:hypothetical protein